MRSEGMQVGVCIGRVIIAFPGYTDLVGKLEMWQFTYCMCSLAQ